MTRDKRSFFERLTGSVSLDEYDDHFEEDEELPQHPARHQEEPPKAHELGEEIEETGEGQLSVDVYQTPDHIVVRAIVAGVRPDQLDISITRDMVTIRGKREEVKEVEGDNYFYQELYWGSFSRTILLPQEVEVDEAEANEKHGVLTIKMPKIDKERQTKLKVKAG